MMRYKCEKCGQIIEETNLNIQSWQEYRGECWGAPAYETMSQAFCPYCNSDDIDEYWEDEDEYII